MRDIIKDFDISIIEKVNFLKERSHYRHFLCIIFDYCFIFSCIFLTINFFSIWVYLICIVLISSRMRALENLLHEGSHGHLCKNVYINNFLSALFCAFPLGHSLSAYRDSHMRHHRYFGDENLDPDFIRYKEMGIDKLPSTKKFLLIHLARIFFLVGMPKYLFGTIKAFVYNKNCPKKEILIRIIFYISLILILIKLKIFEYFLLFWIVPFLTIFQIIKQLSEISEHGGLYHNIGEMQMTRNSFLNPILKFLLYPHNDFCHLVHHIFPNIPGFNLPNAHKILMKNEAYKKAHHCYSFFLKSNRSIISEMIL